MHRLPPTWFPQGLGSENSVKKKSTEYKRKGMLGVHGFSDRLERIFVGKALGKVFAKLSKDCNHERDHAPCAMVAANSFNWSPRRKTNARTMIITKPAKRFRKLNFTV